MPQSYSYNPENGSLYARSFALYDNVPAQQRLFYYGVESDCTNFISQCVWASYGGWLPGFSPAAVETNLKRISGLVRQTGGEWYGSSYYIGSNHWCRVEEFFSYTTNKSKRFGPRSELVTQGTLQTLNPGLVRRGDVIQMVVASYTAERFGHGLYVTQAGPSLDDILICCHTDDRLDVPLSWFAQYPEVYIRQRVLHFEDAEFEK